MRWEEIVRQHTIPAQAAPEPGPAHQLDAGTEAMFAASDAEDARKQAEAWEKTDPDYTPDREADREAGS